MAQENDAEWAVRAALAIQRSLAELNHKNEATDKPALAARIAIDTGPVVVDAASEIFGDVPRMGTPTVASAEQRIADLENSLTQVKLDPVENVPLLAPLLSLIYRCHMNVCRRSRLRNSTTGGADLAGAAPSPLPFSDCPVFLTFLDFLDGSPS